MDSSVFSHPELFFINRNHCLFSTRSLCCDTHSIAAPYAVQMGLLSDELGNAQWMLEVIPHKRKYSKTGIDEANGAGLNSVSRM